MFFFKDIPTDMYTIGSWLLALQYATLRSLLENSCADNINTEAFFPYTLATEIASSLGLASSIPLARISKQIIWAS